jgi:hypothetical protein
VTSQALAAKAKTLNKHGCRRDVQFDNHWVALFCLSKVPELVDTVLLILQARPRRPLHQTRTELRSILKA